jgi:two-component system chemotaxis response regulator CheY
MFLRPLKMVMVIEDDEDTRGVMVQWLRSHGFTALEAVNGDGALVMLRAAPRLVDVILLDLEMPRVDGEAFRKAQLADPRVAHIPVVVVSGKQEAAQTAARMGAPFLPKPLDPEALRRLLETVG